MGMAVTALGYEVRGTYTSTCGTVVVLYPRPLYVGTGTDSNLAPLYIEAPAVDSPRQIAWERSREAWSAVMRTAPWRPTAPMASARARPPLVRRLPPSFAQPRRWRARWFQHRRSRVRALRRRACAIQRRS